MKWDKSDPICIHTLQGCTGRGFSAHPAIAPPVKGSGWISADSWYHNNGIQNKMPIVGGPSPAEVAEYTLASVVTHYFDAWGYFAAATNSLLEQRHRSAIHLAYYGSLHAAMSILASAGISVLKRDHTYIDDSGNLDCFSGQPTHQFTWEALSTWIADQTNASTVQGEITYQTATLEEFAGQLVGASNSTLFQSWFNTWGTDLKTWESDRTARNEVSYRPSFMKMDFTVPVQANTYFLGQIWDLVSPWGKDGFGQVDMIFFYLTLDHAKRTLQLSLKETKARGSTTLSGLGISKEAIEVLIQGYETHHIRLNPVFRHAKNIHRSMDYPVSAHSVLSRSLILIRIAAALCLRHYPRPTLENWARSKATDLGLTDPENQPSDLRDLWLDIEPPLETLNSQQPTSWREFRTMDQSDIKHMFEFERVGLWSAT